MLCHTCIPNAKRGEQNQKWLPHPYLVGGPNEGRNATAPLRSRGTPNRGSKRALTGPVEQSPSRRSYIVQGNPTTNPT